MKHDGQKRGLYDCLKNIKNTTFVDTLSYKYDMTIASAEYWDGERDSRNTSS